MVRGSYKPLAVRRQHANNMKVILACLFGVLVLTGITGHLFSRREETTTPPSLPKPHHEALAKLIRTSEDAIGWIGNKTIDSINNIKNLTTSAVTNDSPLVTKKNKFFDWLRGLVRYNGSASGAESPEVEAPEDSGESVVIAHRTPGHGFSWGPPQVTSPGGATVTGHPGLLLATGRRAHSALSYLYRTSANLLHSGIDTAITAKEALKAKLYKMGDKHERAVPSETLTTGDQQCDGVTDYVCAVDWARNVFSIFRNGCWAAVYNQQRGTNFTIHDSDVCINLLAHRPENYQKIETTE